MSFLSELFKSTNQTRTENEAVSKYSTLSPLLDFFSMAGAMRSRSTEAVALFQRAYDENPEMALRCLFYLRDIRGGLGERNLFRECLSKVPKDVLMKNIQHISTFGRFDDILVLDIDIIGPYIKDQLARDEQQMAKGEQVSLLAKWLPSENTSSKKTRKLALKLAAFLKLSPSKYRKRVVTLRKYITLLEQKMSANKWAEINYEKTPSQAFRKHIKAFKKHDKNRFEKFIQDVKRGDKKVKTDTLFTYEVFDMVKQGHEDAANIVWQNLPDYTRGYNALVIADVSGSMTGRPISVSVSLALYFAERNKGPFKDYFMNFSDFPRLTKVVGNTLSEKLDSIQTSEWGMSTNIEAAFKAILEAAKESNTKGEETPKILYIISDMEFNQCIEDGSLTNFENAKNLFKNEGYELPHVVFWNVNSHTNQVPATMYDKSVTLISGSSQSAFQYAVEDKNPMELMSEVLNSKRYSLVSL